MTGKNKILHEINQELEELYEFIKTLNLSDEDAGRLAKPLSSCITSAKLIRRVRYATYVIVLCAILFYYTESRAITQHAVAISRIVLIKLLPFWDWRKLKNEQCLISFKRDDVLEPLNEPEFNCAFCDSITNIDILYEEEINTRILVDHYIDIHKPVIVRHGTYNWPLYEKPNLTTLLDYPKIANSYPCKFNSNVQRSESDVETTINKIAEFEEYFVHFQNCEVNARKAFRMLTPRPLFLPAQFAPIKSSWLLVGKDYEFRYFKQLTILEPNAVVGVVKGSFIINLIPRLNCKNWCHSVNVQLYRGQALIVTSLWDLNYAPNPTGENIGVILEIP